MCLSSFSRPSFFARLALHAYFSLLPPFASARLPQCLHPRFMTACVLLTDRTLLDKYPPTAALQPPSLARQSCCCATLEEHCFVLGGAVYPDNMDHNRRRHRQSPLPSPHNRQRTMAIPGIWPRAWRRPSHTRVLIFTVPDLASTHGRPRTRARPISSLNFAARARCPFPLPKHLAAAEREPRRERQGGNGGGGRDGVGGQPFGFRPSFKPRHAWAGK